MNATDESKAEPWGEAARILTGRHQIVVQWNILLEETIRKACLEYAAQQTKELADAKLSLECANRVTLETAKERDYVQEQFHAARAECERLRREAQHPGPGTPLDPPPSQPAALSTPEARHTVQVASRSETIPTGDNLDGQHH